jgi:putative redox protein
MVEVGITYDGRLRCTAEHGPSGVRLSTDAPVDNQGLGESFSPTDLVATGLGACILTIMGIAARRDGISLDGTRVRVEKHMSSEPPRRISKLIVRFAFAPGISKDHRNALERCVNACPVKKSIHPDIDVRVSFAYPD